MVAPNFNSRQTVRHGVAEQVSPGIRRVVAANASPFTFTGTASYVVGSGDVAIIDPGPDDDDHLAALLAATKGERVSHILISHTHLDHTSLVPRLVEATGAATYGFGPHGAGRRVQIGAAFSGDAGGDREFTPDIRLADGDVVEAESWHLVALHTPGHCANHLSFAFEEQGALFSGDHVMGWSTSVVAPPDGHMGDYVEALRRLTKRDDRVYWPGHGGPVEQPGRFVRALVAHREAREEAFLKRLKNGDRTVGQIVAAIYRDLDPKLVRAAELTTLAHLIALADRGEIEVLGPLGLEAEFRPTGTVAQ